MASTQNTLTSQSNGSTCDTACHGACGETALTSVLQCVVKHRNTHYFGLAYYITSLFLIPQLITCSTSGAICTASNNSCRMRTGNEAIMYYSV